MDVRSLNFGFLEEHDARLVRLAALAERYFAEDPPGALVKLRQMAELLAKDIAACQRDGRRGRRQLAADKSEPQAVIHGIAADRPANSDG